MLKMDLIKFYNVETPDERDVYSANDWVFAMMNSKTIFLNGRHWDIDYDCSEGELTSIIASLTDISSVDIDRMITIVEKCGIENVCVNSPYGDNTVYKYHLIRVSDYDGKLYFFCKGEKVIFDKQYN